MTTEIYVRIDNDLNLTSTLKNIKIAQKWALVGIALGYEKSVDLGEKIVGQTGRLAYINEIY